jgi:hypothetical protein
MSTTITQKPGIDLPFWRPLSNCPSAQSTGGFLVGDLRNSEDRIPILWNLFNPTNMYGYYPKNDEWTASFNPALAGSMGAGAAGVVAPSNGPRGTIAAGATTTSVVLSTALPAAVGVNQLANRGDGTGYKLRIVDNASGASGKIFEVVITGNTSGTTPTIYWTGAIANTPTTGSAYEFLSGQVFMLTSGAAAAGMFKYYDILTNAFSSNLSITNLPATISTDSCFLSMDELYVPNTQTPGAGFLGNLVATASASGSITGTAAGADAAVASNEYRNFQIRIVQDTGTPTSVGQRRAITSHTAGASPVYTVPAWTVTPSSTATFVIENANWLFLWTSAVSTTYTYANFAITGGGSGAAGLAANTWSSSLFTTRAAAVGSGCCVWHPFGMTLDTAKNARYSYTYGFSGGTSGTLGLFDVAGAANGAASTVTMGGAPYSINTGTCAAYESLGQTAGRYTYLSINGTQRNARFDNLNRVLEPYAFLPYSQSAVSVGGRVEVYQFFDGATSIGTFIQMRNGAVETFGCVNLR